MLRLRSSAVALTFAVGLISLAACSGEKGPAGERGAPGAAGEKGATGADGTQGPQGEQGPSVSDLEKADASAVPDFVMSPAQLMLGRKIEVVITAASPDVDFTTADGAPNQVYFGPEVTVTNVRVLNAKMIAADVAATKNAEVGFREVTVRTGNLPRLLRAPNAFAVRAPLNVEILDGTPSQGGRVRVRVTNMDTIPFDPANLKLSTALVGAPSWLDDDVQYVNESLGALTIKGPNSVEFTAVLDPLATADAFQITLANYSLSGSQADVFFYSARNAIAVAATAPAAITPGIDLENQVGTGTYGTKLYKLTRPAGSLVNLTVSGTGSSADPGYWLTARSGRMEHTLKYEGVGPKLAGTLTSTLLPFDATTGDLYLVVTDGPGRSGNAATYGWKVAATAITATAVAEGSTAHPTGSAQVINTTGGSNTSFVISGTINGSDTEDVYRINLASAARLQISLTRRNFLADMEVSTDAAFTTSETIPMINTLLVGGQTTGSAATWYIKVPATGDNDLTSYTLAVRPF